MVDVLETVDKLTRSFQERLTARTAYGEPVTANGITVIPVARVAFGLGGGGGGGTAMKPGGDGAGEPGAAERPALSAAEGAGDTSSGSGGGGGGGGGGVVQPMGFIEISETGARWVPLEPPRGELILRALMATAVIAPGGGRRGFLRRLLLMLAGQALIGQLMRPRLPPLPALSAVEGPESWRFARQVAEEPA